MTGIIKTISPADARQLMQNGARLVDIREPDEYARVHIAGAENRPVNLVDHLARHDGAPVIYHCRSGNRTAAHAARLAAAAGDCACYILEGGLDGWQKAGLPVVADRGQPLELMRQVQIAAGILVLGGSLLAVFAAPGFIVIPAFVGAGLVTAGVTGWCGMARLLATMPWNRRLARSHPVTGN